MGSIDVRKINKVGQFRVECESEAVAFAAAYARPPSFRPWKSVAERGIPLLPSGEVLGLARATRRLASTLAPPEMPHQKCPIRIDSPELTHQDWSMRILRSLFVCVWLLIR